MIQHNSEVFHWMKIAGQSESMEAELDDAWESWVARPCIETCLAPRQARASLEIIGHLANHGCDVGNILYELIMVPKFRKIIVGEDNKKMEKTPEDAGKINLIALNVGGRVSWGFSFSTLGGRMGSYNLEEIDKDFEVASKGAGWATVNLMALTAKKILKTMPDNAERDMAISHLLQATDMVLNSWTIGEAGR